jgi:hypothetical protein
MWRGQTGEYQGSDSPRVSEGESEGRPPRARDAAGWVRQVHAGAGGAVDDEPNTMVIENDGDDEGVGGRY